jgi:hypothetical protein
VDRSRVAADAQNEIFKEREYRRTLVDIKWPVPGLEGYKRIWGVPSGSHPPPAHTLTPEAQPTELVVMSDSPKPGLLSFTIRDLFWLTAVVAIVLWALYTKSATSGRYVMEYHQDVRETFLLDTATGQCWKSDDNRGTWADAKSPPSLKK